MEDFGSELSLLDAAMEKVKNIPKLPRFQNLINAEAFLSLDLPPPEWFVDWYLPKNALVFFGGAPGSYKTFFSMKMAYALATGTTLFDRLDVPSAINASLPVTKVMFVEEEMHRNLMQHRLKLFRRPGHAPLDNLTMYMNSGFKLSNEKDVRGLAEYIGENQIKVLFLDPFSTVAGMENENDNSEASTILDMVRQVLIDGDLGLTIVCVHHH